MCEKIGVREEGLQINHIFQNGKFRNLVLVGILREEFYKKNLNKLINLGLIIE